MNYQEFFKLASNLSFKEGKIISYNEIIDSNYKLFSASQPIYICNLLNGDITYKRNLKKLFLNTAQTSTLQEINDQIHPDDIPKVVHIVRYTLKYLAEKGVSPDSYLSVSYRIRNFIGDYVQVNRISRLIKSSDEALVFNLSIIYKLPCFSMGKPVQFGWFLNNVQDKDHKNFAKEGWDSIFSCRESEILELIVSGKKYAEIAEVLFISENTVKKHLSNVKARTGMNSKTDLLNLFEINKL